MVVPAGFRAVIRDVEVFNADPLSTNDAQIVHVDSNCTVYQRTIGLQQWLHDELRIAADAGETFSFLPGFDVDMYVTGYLLSLP